MIDNEIYEKIYDALCKKIGCNSIEASRISSVCDFGYTLKAFIPRNSLMFDNESYCDPYLFWINDSTHLLNFKYTSDCVKKDIVVSIFDCLKDNFLKVKNIILDKGLTIEKFMIESDLSS